MDQQKLIETIEAKASGYTDFLVEISSIESPSHDKAAVDAVSDLIERFALDHNLNVSRTLFERSGDGLLIETDAMPGVEPVSLLAHMDTVHEPGAFGDPPVQIRDGYMFGPGVHDCKGGIAIALLVMDALKENGFLERPIRLVLVPDEEVSSALSGSLGIQFIREAVRGSRFAFCCESGNKNGSVAVGRKGILKLEVSIQGKAAHAGSAYHSGISAIREAAHKIIKLEAYDAFESVTINCGVIAGGDKPNIVPDRCSFALDVRFRKNTEKEAALSHIEKIVNHAYVPGTRSTLRVLSERIPMERTEGNLSLLSYLNEINELLGLQRLTPFIAGGGADSAYAVQEGVPTVCSLGIIGSDMHTLNEQAEIQSIVDRSKLLATAIVHGDRFVNG